MILMRLKHWILVIQSFFSLHLDESKEFAEFFYIVYVWHVFNYKTMIHCNCLMQLEQKKRLKSIRTLFQLQQKLYNCHSQFETHTMSIKNVEPIKRCRDDSSLMKWLAHRENWRSLHSNDSNPKPTWSNHIPSIQGNAR